MNTLNKVTESSSIRQTHYLYTCSSAQFLRLEGNYSIFVLSLLSGLLVLLFSIYRVGPKKLHTVFIAITLPTLSQFS